ncbi:40S ribosomal protein S29-like [Ursus americanus]|uniref:40S ribosomal protein S29-like n=1 Tax=Ursus maritimus TaxID=29073 RepID=A0A8M1GES6_URSMA|nr:40S ribosomal protein S29-like [Ursus maritimus]XP_045662239.1 40S ribosomal protein S29-like [Ursus americanus]XP_048078325.1 40S ribosomal protein S29-like [Ursus arctos]
MRPFASLHLREQDGSQQLFWSHLRKFGQGSPCCLCSKQRGLIGQYSLIMGCQRFRQYMKDIDFIKLD